MSVSLGYKTWAGAVYFVASCEADWDPFVLVASLTLAMVVLVIARLLQLQKRHNSGMSSAEEARLSLTRNGGARRWTSFVERVPHHSATPGHRIELATL